MAVFRETRQILDWEVGCRGIKTLKKLWKRLQLFKVEVYCADHWKAYNAVLLVENWFKARLKRIQQNRLGAICDIGLLGLNDEVKSSLGVWVI
ncbi:MAG: IS1 family transposase [Vampirovibrio sp.]|nr:IS1 family transposase [Vampirovibrio sp.]